MILSFGAAWPVYTYKAIVIKSNKGVSLFFLVVVGFGYLCGIAAKLTSGSITYVFFFYLLNLLMVSINIILYFRNRRLDQESQ